MKRMYIANNIFFLNKRLEQNSLPMKKTICFPFAVSLLAFASAAACLSCFHASAPEQEDVRMPSFQTYCNPLNIPYRFALRSHQQGKVGREAADPFIRYKDGTYWLFASKCGGYFHSKDLVHWNFIAQPGYPTEQYAPTAMFRDNKCYFLGSSGRELWVNDDPLLSKPWTLLRRMPDMPDPDLFQDDDGRVYVYWGCSDSRPLYGQELDPANNFEPIGQPVVLVQSLDLLHHGWEAQDSTVSDSEITKQKPWMEGSDVIKHKGKYYLQYAAPGTELRTYADGVYVADKPLGPYHYEQYSPAVYKPSGFIASAGHGSTFTTKENELWRISTMKISVNFMFERRIGLFPAAYLPRENGQPDQLHCDTYLGDYPQLVPGQKPYTTEGSNLAGYMLLSLKKDAKASSVLDPAKYPVSNAFDEQIETSWAAATGNPGEWLQVDLGKKDLVCAVQINFSDINAQHYDILKDAYQYTLEYSSDGKTWNMLVDKKDNHVDAPHDYIQLERPVMARYMKLTNYHMPANAVFSLSGLRVFGSGLGQKPAQVDGVTAVRPANRRTMNVKWNPARNADFYIVRYGIHPDRLNHNMQVYDANEVLLYGLNTDSEYYVTVDAINDSGITRGKKAIQPKQ